MSSTLLESPGPIIPEETMDSPDPFFDRIGKLNESWSMELSPIAPARNSDSSESKSTSPRDTEATASPKEDSKSQVSTKETGNDNDGENQPGLTKEDPIATADSTTPALSEQKIAKIDTDTAKASGNPTWFMTADVTTPLSTSCEFSLELGSGGSPDSESSPDSNGSDKTPELDGTAVSKENTGKSSSIDSPTDNNDKQGGTDTNAQPGLETNSSSAAETTSAAQSKADSPSSEVEVTLEDEAKETPPALAAEIEHQTTDNNLDSCLMTQEPVERPADNTAAFESESKRECSPSKDLAISTSLNLGDPDTSSLIADATQKVKKFIHNLSLTSPSPLKKKRDERQVPFMPLCNTTNTIESDAQKESDGDEYITSSGPNDADTNSQQERLVTFEQHSPPSFRSPGVKTGSLMKEQHPVTSPFGELVENTTEKTSMFASPSKNSIGVASSSNNVSADENTTEKTSMFASPSRHSNGVGNSFSSHVSAGPSPGKQDYNGAKKQLEATSFEFIQRISGAAKARTRQITRSRDSLAAKVRDHEIVREQEKALAAAAEEEKALQQRSASSEAERRKHQHKVVAKSFKARPAPSSSIISVGGSSGIPQVTKKPATVPSSPLLGLRRPNPPKIKALKQPVRRPRFSTGTSIPESSAAVQKKKVRSSLSTTSEIFKARPAPATTGNFGRAGQSGVPKVPKRPVTVPESPCLGPRRRQSSAVVGKENRKQTRRISTGMVNKRSTQAVSKASPTMSTSSLLGLDFVSIKSANDRELSPITTTPRHATYSGFEPSSTQRAKKRAEFEERRAINEKLRLEQEMKQREQRVRSIYGELDTLREII